MRMWMIDPRLLCRQHLLGEHKELHMIVGTFRRGKPLMGWCLGGLIEPTHVYQRHEAIASEMLRRGYQHRTPIDRATCLEIGQPNVSVSRSLQDLRARCSRCVLP